MFRNQASSIVERPLTFGQGGTLVGIESSSMTAAASGQRPAIILLNAGLIHRVGPNRLHVTIARRLAAAGYSSLRFDLSGRGDSESRGDALPFLVSSVAETIAAMDYLEAGRGINRFVLMGICSGAVNALQTAMADARVVGAVVIDAPAYPTRGYYFRYYLKRLVNGESWRNTLMGRNALGRRLLGRRFARPSAGEDVDDFGIPEAAGRMPEREEAEQALEKMVERGTRMLVIYSGTWSAYNYRNQFRDTFPRVMKTGAVDVEYFPDADHTFTKVANQQRLVGTIARWVTSSWPVAAERSPAVSGPDPVPAPEASYDIDPRPLDEAESVVAAITENHQPAGLDRRRRFQWLYRANPAGPGELFLLRSTAVAGGKETVGCTGLSQRRFLYRGRALRGALFADFAVDRAHRTGLPELQLLQTARTLSADRYDIAYGVPSAGERGVFLRLGFSELGPMTRYVKVLRDVHRDGTPRTRLGSRRAALRNAITLRRERRLGAAVPSGLEFEWLQDFDLRFDELARSLTAITPVLGERNANWLRWRFGPGSGTVAGIAALTEAASGRLRSYAVVVAKDHGIAAIEDFAGATQQDLSHLWARLIPDLRFQSFNAATVAFLGPSWVVESLKEQGFQLGDTGPSVVVAAPDQNPSDIATPDDWYLTGADSVD